MAQVIIDGTVFPVPDDGDFTFGELADMEEVAGAPLNQLPSGSVRATLAVMYVAMRRVDPTITVDQVRALTPDQFDFVDEPEPGPPTAAVGEDGSGGVPQLGAETSGAL